VNECTEGGQDEERKKAREREREGRKPEREREGGRRKRARVRERGRGGEGESDRSKGGRSRNFTMHYVCLQHISSSTTDPTTSRNNRTELLCLLL